MLSEIKSWLRMKTLLLVPPFYRDSKYKTRLCVSFWTSGMCVYGPRCNFVHLDNEEAIKTAVKNVSLCHLLLLSQDF